MVPERVTTRPRLLFLCQTLPYPLDSGVAIRSYHTLRILSRVFDITALCFYRRKRGLVPEGPGPSLVRLRSLARVEAFPIPQEHSVPRLLWDHLRSLALGRVYTAFAYQSRPFTRRLGELLGSSHFDLVHVDSMVLARYGAAAGSGGWGAGGAGEGRGDGSGTRRPSARPGGKVASQKYCRASRFGNHDALQNFCDAILPLVRAEGRRVPVRWIGRASARTRSAYRRRYDVELTGFLADIRPAVRDAACYVVPLRVGGGTRVKILDAWAMGKAVDRKSTRLNSSH